MQQEKNLPRPYKAASAAFPHRGKHDDGRYAHDQGRRPPQHAKPWAQDLRTHGLGTLRYDHDGHHHGHSTEAIDDCAPKQGFDGVNRHHIQKRSNDHGPYQHAIKDLCFFRLLLEAIGHSKGASDKVRRRTGTAKRPVPIIPMEKSVNANRPATGFKASAASEDD